LSIEKGCTSTIGLLGYLYEKQNKLDLANEYYLLGVEKNDFRSITQICNIMTKTDNCLICQEYTIVIPFKLRAFLLS
jgi:hypothetical protein